MISENKYVEEIQNEPLQPKQSGYNISQTTSGRDTSQHIFQDDSGIEHIFITFEQIQDLINSSLINTPLLSDIYVKVTSIEELTTTISFPGDFTIYCDSGSNSGLVITADNTSGLIVNGKKTIIGAGGTSFSFQGTGLFVTSIFIDVQTNSELNILDKMDFVSHGDSVTISNIGDGILRMSEIRSDVDAVSLYVTHGIPSPGIVDPSKCLLEINNFNIQPNDIGTKMLFELWSGKHTSFLINNNISQVVAKEHRMSSEGVGTLNSEIVEFLGSASTTSPLNYRNYNYTLGVNTFLYAQDQNSARSFDIIAQYRSDFKKKLLGQDDLLHTALQLNGNTQGFVTKNTDPWDENIVLFQIGSITLYTSGLTSGIVYNAYNDGNWRFSSSENAKLETIDNGKRTVYKNSNTPVVDDVINWVSGIDGGYKYVSYIGTPSLGVISGLTIPILNSGAGAYQVTLKGEVSSALSGSEYRLQMAIKQNGNELDVIIVHQFDSSSTLVVEDRTFCTSFVCEVSTDSDFQFEVTAIDNLLSIAELKSSAIRIA